MELRFGGPSAYGSPCDQVGNELRARDALDQMQVAHDLTRASAIEAMSTHLIVSSSSHPTGMPMSLRSHRSSRAILNPLLILNDPSISGSLISPFQPTVVRGFSLRPKRQLPCCPFLCSETHK